MLCTCLFEEGEREKREKEGGKREKEREIKLMHLYLAYVCFLSPFMLHESGMMLVAYGLPFFASVFVALHTVDIKQTPGNSFQRNI